MTILTVQSVIRGEKSFKVHSSDGKNYYTSIKSGSKMGIEQTQGRTIDAVVKDSDDGRISFIDGFTYVEGSAVPAKAESGVMPFWWPSVSNVWAAAIAAGHIKSPADLAAWAGNVQAIAEKKSDQDVDF